MSINFKISSKQNNGDLHIDMYGDFDGSSACELANAIKMEYPGTGEIFINTKNLSEINQFGSVVLENIAAVQNLPVDSMVFIGFAETVRGQAGYALFRSHSEHDCSKCDGRCKKCNGDCRQCFSKHNVSKIKVN